MKVKNKLTGEINILKVDEDYFKIYKNDGEFVCPVTLKELNDGWEDYEEPKEYWRIGCDGAISHGKDDFDTPFDNACKSIGNYFETKEEAEKVVEKLKALKRLKDKGVEFYSWRKNHTGTYDFLARWRDVPPKMHDIINDLDLLFGGEE